MFPGKRRHHDDGVVDLPFLLNAGKMLTEKEFICRMPSSLYADYVERFLKRKIIDTFEKYAQQQWFRDRYLGEGIPDSQVPFSSNKFVMLRNLGSDIPAESLANEFQCISGVARVYVSQNDCTRGFARDLYLNLSQDTEPESVMSCIEQDYDPAPLDLDTMPITEHYLASLPQLENVYAALCQLNNFDESSMLDTFFSHKERKPEKTIQSYTEILRDVFNFCSTCCKQYDNKCAMVFHCSRHTKQDFCSRVLDLFGCSKDFPYAKIALSGAGLEKLTARTPEGNFKCRRCSKAFSSMEFVNAHLASRHNESLESINRTQSQFDQFLSRIDFFILDMVQGTVDRVVPSYAVTTVANSAVVYDMPKVFSGDIAFD